MTEREPYLVVLSVLGVAAWFAGCWFVRHDGFWFAVTCGNLAAMAVMVIATLINLVKMGLER